MVSNDDRRRRGRSCSRGKGAISFRANAKSKRRDTHHRRHDRRRRGGAPPRCRRCHGEAFSPAPKRSDFGIGSVPATERRRSTTERTTEKARRSLKMPLPLILSCLLLSLLPPPLANAMVYLEDPDGALLHDALPERDEPPSGGSSSWMLQPHHDYLEESKWGTPEHYLTHPPSPTGTPITSTHSEAPSGATSEAPSALPSESPSASPADASSSPPTTAANATNVDVVPPAANNSAPAAEMNATALVDVATNPDQHDNHASSSIFDRMLNAFDSLAVPPPAGSTTQPPTASRPPSAAPSASLPTKSPSVIPEVTGEYSHHHGRDDPFTVDHHGLFDDGDGPWPRPLGYFSDLKLIRSPRRYVYYDSKQARFGADLGPRGEASFVNLVLPPRWGGGWWEEADARGEGYIKFAVSDGLGGGDEEDGEDEDSVDAANKASAHASRGDAGAETAPVAGQEPKPGRDPRPRTLTGREGDPLEPVGGADSLFAVENDDAMMSGIDPLGGSNASIADEASFGGDPATVDEYDATSGEANDDAIWAADNGTILEASNNNISTSGERNDDSFSGVPNSDTLSWPSSFSVGAGSEENATGGIAGEFQNETADGVANGNAMLGNQTGIVAGTISILEGALNATFQDGSVGTGTVEAESPISEDVAWDSPQKQQQERPDVPHLLDNHHITDCFCLEDFVNWRIHVRNVSKSTDMAADFARALDLTASPSSAPSAPPSAPPRPHEDGAESDARGAPPRPLAVAVRRGRCSFESKARMAMVLNDLLRLSGRSDRIGHLVVHNNVTAPAVHAAVASNAKGGNNESAAAAGVDETAAGSGNGTAAGTTGHVNGGDGIATAEKGGEDEGEKLVEMSRVTSPQEMGEVTVGLVYVATSSGRDLLRRMEERQAATGISPRLDLDVLFPDDSREDGADETPDDAPGTPGRRGRRLREEKRRRTLHPPNSIDGSTKDDGVHEGTIPADGQEDTDGDGGGWHDPRITRGWFFPATLTKFCRACGPPRYGFFPNPVPGGGDGSDGFASDGGFFPGGSEGTGPQLGEPLRPHPDSPIHGGGNGRPYYGGTYYYTRPWLDAVRKMMIAILVLLLVGPLLLAARRWRTVGGTFRMTRDENGSRRIRIVGPNLEVFVNGVPGTVETNGTKLDRAQVFELPEVEYVGGGGEEGGEEGVADGGEEGAWERDDGGDDGVGFFATAIREGIANPKPLEGSIHIDSSLHQSADATDQSALSTAANSLSSSSHPVPVTPSREESSCPSSAGGNGSNRRFVSSSCCSICIEEFVPGELLRVLPRCNHAFHTECILPWLTERQGCCPMCKMPVLPEELQRGRRRRARGSAGRDGGGTPSSRRHRGERGGRSFRQIGSARGSESGRSGRGRNYRPLSTPGGDAAEEAVAGASQNDNDAPSLGGIRLVSEIEGDLDAAIAGPPMVLQGVVVTPDGSPRSSPGASCTPVPFGTEGGGSAAATDRHDGGPPLLSELNDIGMRVMEQGRNRPLTPVLGDEANGDENGLGDEAEKQDPSRTASMAGRGQHRGGDAANTDATNITDGESHNSGGIISREGLLITEEDALVTVVYSAPPGMSADETLEESNTTSRPMVAMIHDEEMSGDGDNGLFEC